MDPISAAGLAASILQFIQFGGSILSNTHEIHTSVLGALPGYIDCEKITTRLVELAEKLKSSLDHDPQNVQSAPSTTPRTLADADAERLKEICNDCLKASKILLERVEKLRWNENEKRQVWKSLRQALKSVWSKKDLDQIAGRLSEFKKDLELHLCVEIRKKIAEVKDQLQKFDKELGNVFISLEENKKWTIQTLLEERGFLKSVLTDTKDIMLNASAEQWAKTQETIITAIGKTATQDIEESLLESLAFPMMHHRERAIPDAHKATFQWVFHSSKGKTKFSGNFVKWLESDSGVYWMKGKAASGKSTLMKFILENPRTLQHLQKWSGDSSLHIGSFYFWLGGSREQRTQEGLFRSLLHQFLRKHPSLVRHIFPYEWTEHCSIGAQNESRSFVIQEENRLFAAEYESNLSAAQNDPQLLPILDQKRSRVKLQQMPDWDWSLKNLKAAFARLCSFPTTSLKICFFIDGLDEYEGDQESLAEFFKSLSFSLHIKVCLSSRPWIVFEDAFANCPGLRLQDLTFHDIEGFVQTELGNHTKMKQLLKKSPKDAKALISEIVTKADGVFLWVELVVRSLLQGLRNHDNISVLGKRLRELPSDLAALYKHMLKSVESVYEERASQIFQIYHAMWLVRESHEYSKIFRKLTASNGSISALELEIAVNASRQQTEIESFEPMSQQEIDERSLRMDDLLKTHCAGLLETDIVAPPTYVYESDVVDTRPLVLVSYLHRTVRDFLISEDVLAFQRSLSKTSFNPNTSLLMCCTTMLKRSLCTNIYNGQPYESIIATSELGFLHAELCERAGSGNYVEFLEMFHQAAEITLSSYGQGSVHWAQYFNPYREFGDIRGFSSRWRSEADVAMLISAIRRKLYGYLDRKLALKDTQFSSQQESSLLLLLLSRLDYDKELPDIAIIQLFLKYEADPNALRNGHTAWQHFLQSAHTYSIPNFPPRKPDLDALAMWVQIFKLFLQHGASPFTTCTKCHRTWTPVDCEGNFVLRFTECHRVENVVKEVFGRLLPKEAAELLRMVELRKKFLDQTDFTFWNLGVKRLHDIEFEQDEKAVKIRIH